MAKTTAPLLLALQVLALSVVIVSAAARHGEHDGGGFLGMPWFGPPGRDAWGGWGAGSGGPGPGGFARHGVEPPSTVCTEKGPCYKKKLTCPAKCFKSFSFKGKHGGGGGGGGGCSFDCKKRCKGYC